VISLWGGLCEHRQEVGTTEHDPNVVVTIQIETLNIRYLMFLESGVKNLTRG
jgi:hypothetical protein